MPATTILYRCLLISPADVSEERALLVPAVDRWNAHIGQAMGVRIELVRWELHSTPALGGRAQSLLNEQIVDNCDFGIAVFGSRLGTPTGGYPSGSAEEIKRLTTVGARVMVYFRSTSEVPDTRDPVESDRLRAFRKELQQQGLVSQYTDSPELVQLVVAHLATAVHEAMQDEALPTAASASQDQTTLAQHVVPRRYRPVFDSELWPEEGIPVFRATRTSLELFERPSRLARRSEVHRVKLGQLVEFDGFRYRTIAPGVVLAKTSGSLSGRNLGRIAYLSTDTYYKDPASEWRCDLIAGTEIDYLQYRAEGSGLIRWDGDCVELTTCPWLQGSDTFELVADPEVEQWLRVVDAKHTLGWLRVADEVEEVGRSF